MRRLFALLLALSLLLTTAACGKTQETDPGSVPQVTAAPGDADYLRCTEDLVYGEAAATLGGASYVVTDVHAAYFSQEYLDEMAYNSLENIYFGHTLSELNQAFQGTRCVFTLGEDGQTEIRELQAVTDQDTAAMLRHAAIGGGVLLVCVIAIPVAQAAGAPAVMAIAAVAAKSGAAAAVTGAAAGGVLSAAIQGFQTGDLDQALRAGAQGAADGLMTGAIVGALGGAATQAAALKSLTRSGLTMHEAASLQAASGYPRDVIAQFHSMKEYEVYRDAGLHTKMVSNRTALVPELDLKHLSTRPDGTKLTNLERMKQGLAPLDPATGKPYQLHHIGQERNGTLAVLKEAQHQGKASILNIPGKAKGMTDAEFKPIREAFWKDLARQFS